MHTAYRIALDAAASVLLASLMIRGLALTLYKAVHGSDTPRSRAALIVFSHVLAADAMPGVPAGERRTGSDLDLISYLAEIDCVGDPLQPTFVGALSEVIFS